MNEPKKAYSYGHLITIATIADEIAIARGTVGHDELRDLAKRFASGELKTPPLFPPHQLWQHGGDASRIGAATPDPDGVWRILFKKTSKPHQSDKDAFNHPPSAYTWHMLAADVYELGQQPVWKTQTAAALRNLACRYNSDLLDEMPEPAAQQPKPAAVEAFPAQAQAAKPLQRSSAQDAMILTAIRKAGHNPLALPVNEPGKAGVKAEIRNALRNEKLLTGSTVFDKAWERLRKQGDIADTD